MSSILSSKYIIVAWGDYTWKMRKWRFRHQKRTHNVYLQIGSLEIVVWYR